MERVERPHCHARVAGFEDGVRALEERRADRDQAQASRGHVSGDLSPGAPAVRGIDDALPLLAQQGGQALDEHELRRPCRLAIHERRIEIAIRLTDDKFDENGRVEVHAARGQSRASRSSRTRASARAAFFGRPRSSARLTRNGGGGLSTSPTSLALGRPAEVITISSPAAARSSSSDRRAFAVRTLAIMSRV